MRPWRKFDDLQRGDVRVARWEARDPASIGPGIVRKTLLDLVDELCFQFVGKGLVKKWRQNKISKSGDFFVRSSQRADRQQDSRAGQAFSQFKQCV